MTNSAWLGKVRVCTVYMGAIAGALLGCVGIYEHVRSQQEMGGVRERVRQEAEARMTLSRRLDVLDGKVSHELSLARDAFARVQSQQRQVLQEMVRMNVRVIAVEFLLKEVYKGQEHVSHDVAMMSEQVRREVSGLAEGVRAEVGQMRGQVRSLEDLQGDVNELTLSVMGLQFGMEGAERVRSYLRPGELETLMIAPTVRVVCGGEHGSGVIIFSHQSGSRASSLVVTAQHVVREQERFPVVVEIFDAQGKATNGFMAEYIAGDEGADIALLQVGSEACLPSAALLPLECVREVSRFDKTYVVGCALGGVPSQTLGEIDNIPDIASNRWGTSAPSIFGNSGGGVFLAETGELIGIVTGVGAYKVSQDFIAVPHVSFFSPVSGVYALLENTTREMVARLDTGVLPARAVPSVLEQELYDCLHVESSE